MGKSLLKDIETKIDNTKKAIDDIAIACERYNVQYDKYAKDNIVDAGILKERLKDAVVKVMNDEIR